ncbi:hypothetical protein [Lichenibacterium dinghuense]|uniref:hypothetical protein n=1 Tax=Lichenibacterium dinghuense TaxID=2895977 RepID=UPI001F256B1A|nr:hypothetical protein [Lichenibacterium sp. 6Y81]
MPSQKPASRRHFTPAARALAIEARRRKQETALPKGTPEVFVVRDDDPIRGYGWEIRRFGAVVLDKGLAIYSTTQAARSAGEMALSARTVEA